MKKDLLIFFLTKSWEGPISRFFLWENVQISSIILFRISVPNFLLHDKYFFIEKQM